MRDPKIQEELDNMSVADKEKRTTPEAMRERGIVIKEYNDWILCKNEFPHKERGDKQMVLWRKSLGKTTLAIIAELQEVIEDMIKDGYHAHRHPEKDQSCPHREHWHIYKL